MIDVEVANGRSFSAVLALVAVANHEVSSRKPHREPRGPVVVMKVKHARHAEHAAHDGHAIVAVTNGQHAPNVEVVFFAFFVDGTRDAAVEENERALGRGEMHGLERAVEYEDRSRQGFGHGVLPGSDFRKRRVPSKTIASFTRIARDPADFPWEVRYG